MNRILSALLIAVIPALSGCSTYRIYVSRESKPLNPTFTVIPSWQNDDEAEFGAAIEAALMKVGLKLIERPGYIYNETDATRTASFAVGGANVAAGEAVTRPVKALDVVAMYSKTSANYIAVTNGANYRVRIIRREDQALVASIEIMRSRQFIDTAIYNALAQAGIIKDVKLDAAECKPLNPPGTKIIRGGTEYSQ